MKAAEKKTRAGETTIMMLAAVLLFLFMPLVVMAGDLEPTAEPAPTMHTLEEIYDILDPFNKAPGDVCLGVTFLGVRDDGTIGERTGTRLCGSLPTTTTTIFIPPPPTTTTTTPASRFTYNGDGTVTDNLTGLIWLQDSSCFGKKDWPDSKIAAYSLESGACGLTDNSQIGDWRLPTIDEFDSIIDRSQDSPALTLGHPFANLPLRESWTSTLVPDSASGPVYHVWYVDVKYGQLMTSDSIPFFNMWPVRGVATGP